MANVIEKAAGWIYEKGSKKRIFEQKEVRKNLRTLHPEMGERVERERIYLKEYYVKKISSVLLLMIIGSVSAIALVISSRMEGTVAEGKYISRNAYGEGSKETELLVEIEPQEKIELLAETESQEGEGFPAERKARAEKQQFTLTVEERSYDKETVKRLAADLKEVLPQMILGNNQSLEEVCSDLNLIQEAEGYPFRIDWESGDYSVIYSDGCVTNEETDKTGKVVQLTAILTYGDYREEYIFPIHIFPPEYSEEELWKRRIQELLVTEEEESREESYMELPENIDGRKLVWSEQRENGSGYLFLLTCLGAVLIFLFQDKELSEKVEKRNKEMLLDYPQLITKLTLYMGAGMSIRNAFRKIASDYRKEKEAGGKYHYVYEEMLLACHELDSGVSEVAAYEHFGKRCRLPLYTKFASLLVQNLRKGSNGLLTALRLEAGNAFEERKNTARKLGEEAGTKLLFPMMLMLGIVMVLIIVPAYLSFSV